MKRNGALIHATTWLNFENMPRGRSQTQEDHVLYTSKSIETESILVVARDWGVWATGSK